MKTSVSWYEIWLVDEKFYCYLPAGLFDDNSVSYFARDTKRLKHIYYTQLFGVFENHVIAFSAAEKSPENEAT